jgi:hypothetical protein
MVGSLFGETGSDARQTATRSATFRVCTEEKLKLDVVNLEVDDCWWTAAKSVSVQRLFTGAGLAAMAIGTRKTQLPQPVGASRARTRWLRDVRGVPMRDGHGVANGITFSSPPNGPRVASALAVFGFTEGQRHRRRPRQWSTTVFVKSVAECSAVCLLDFAYSFSLPREKC